MYILIDYDRRDAICVMSLDCWLRIDLILLIYAVEAIHPIPVMMKLQV